MRNHRLNYRKLLFLNHFFKILLIYLFMRDTQREAETQAEGETDSLRGTKCGTRSWDPGIMT